MHAIHLAMVCNRRKFTKAGKLEQADIDAVGAKLQAVLDIDAAMEDNGDGADVPASDAQPTAAPAPTTSGGRKMMQEAPAFAPINIPVVFHIMSYKWGPENT